MSFLIDVKRFANVCGMFVSSLACECTIRSRQATGRGPIDVARFLTFFSIMRVYVWLCLRVCVLVGVCVCVRQIPSYNCKQVELLSVSFFRQDKKSRDSSLE